MKKLLIIRFSSIGDIVLTTPIVRCLKTQLDNCEIHYIVKSQYSSILQSNPYVTKVFTFDENINEVVSELKAENYDFIIDLHKNIRSKSLISKLKKTSYSINKINIKKWLIVNFKINKLPNIHIVDRYFKAVEFLNIKNDKKGLDYFIPENDNVKLESLPVSHRNAFIGIVIGAKFKTKQFPVEKLIALCEKIEKPIILLGGPEDKQMGDEIVKEISGKVFNSCGKFNINQSASLVQQAEKIITNDTGLMHIAAAFNKEIVTVWGNTIPGFGMYPYLPEANQSKSKIIEIKNLKCRPCSKIGFQKCPKKHFDCMMKIDVDELLEFINK
ncbi:MAG: glycosyltransferase family 9 protein [Saprospiraceae bacterium]|nr:glycosyltransferase family 9 protein [Saprospiraceae bacterium]